MSSSILGSRIRQRRREIGVTQTELARRVGISASYLNLIEWNKRPIAGALLRRIAESLDFALEDLDGESERRLLESLTEIARLPALHALGIEHERTNEMIGRFPGWSRGFAALARSERKAAAHVQTLSDRLTNDPYLSETLHRMLTRIASIRSAVEILTEYADIPTDQQDRFIHIIHEESGVLSNVGEALAAYLDKSEESAEVLTPLDEVETLFNAHKNHFAEIEDAASALGHLLTDPQPISRREKAVTLSNERLGDVIDEIIASQVDIKTTAAKTRARRALFNYAVGALLMPIDSFTARAVDLGYDLEALAEAFSTEVSTVCHRLTALPRGKGIPEFGYFRANAAGTIIEMLGLDGLAVPRYVSACPLWVLYRAQQSPEAVIRQRAL
ncbi:MAG: helix-turn-helix domain-containing protein, partial [Alphaproteobacteria bacterium]|nr:helix-turn-helix domain-containing protein [Alphaproteobacteria bacterium]